jgi:hypothetical protein
MSVGNTVGDTKLLYVVILVSLKDLEFRDSKLLKYWKFSMQALFSFFMLGGVLEQSRA